MKVMRSLPRGKSRPLRTASIASRISHDQVSGDAQPLSGSGDPGRCSTAKAPRSVTLSVSGYAVANHEAVVCAGNAGLVWIVVEAAVQPDPELPGQALRNGCGELHSVRLSVRPDDAGRSRRVPVAGADTFGLLSLRLWFLIAPEPVVAGCADVAQLVEHHLASEVAGSNPVVRSERVSAQSQWGAVFPGEWPRRGNGLQIRAHGFKSRLHLGRLARSATHFTHSR